ncbi:hypothetical protein TPCV2_16020 [Cutibacterium avidum]
MLDGFERGSGTCFHGVPGNAREVCTSVCNRCVFCCAVQLFTAPTWRVGLTVDLRGRTPAFLLTVAWTTCDPVAAWAQP